MADIRDVHATELDGLPIHVGDMVVVKAGWDGIEEDALCEIVRIDANDKDKPIKVVPKGFSEDWIQVNSLAHPDIHNFPTRKEQLIATLRVEYDMITKKLVDIEKAAKKIIADRKELKEILDMLAAALKEDNEDDA